MVTGTGKHSITPPHTAEFQPLPPVVNWVSRSDEGQCTRNNDIQVKPRDLSEGLIEEHVEDGRPLGQLSVLQLKIFLRNKGLPVSGTKGMLMEKISKYLRVGQQSDNVTVNAETWPSPAKDTCKRQRTKRNFKRLSDCYTLEVGKPWEATARGGSTEGSSVTEGARNRNAEDKSHRDQPRCKRSRLPHKFYTKELLGNILEDGGKLDEEGSYEEEEGKVGKNEEEKLD